jgi:hypothetical protein
MTHEMRKYHTKLKGHMERMSAMEYRPRRQRGLGRFWKRWKDQECLCFEAGSVVPKPREEHVEECVPCQWQSANLFDISIDELTNLLNVKALEKK